MKRDILSTQERNQKIIEIFDDMETSLVLNYSKRVPEAVKYLDSSNPYPKDIPIDFIALSLCTDDDKIHRKLQKLKVADEDLQKQMTYSFLAFSPKSEETIDKILGKGLGNNTILTFICLFNCAMRGYVTPKVKELYSEKLGEVNNTIGFYRNKLSGDLPKKMDNLFNKYFLKVMLEI